MAVQPITMQHYDGHKGGGVRNIITQNSKMKIFHTVQAFFIVNKICYYKR